MKKFIFLVLLISAFATTKAQIPGFAIKVMGGVNSSGYVLPDAQDVSHSPGYAFSLDVSLGKKHYVQGGFSLRNYKSAYSLNGKNSNVKFNAFNAHLYYGWQFLDLAVVKTRVFTGPVMDFTGAPKSKDFSFSQENYNSQVFNFAFGAEAKIAFLLVSLQYEFGLSSMMSNANVKNNIIVAKVGISIL